MIVFYLEFEGAQQQEYGARYMRVVVDDSVQMPATRPLYTAVRVWRMHEEHGLIKIKDRYLGNHGPQELTPEITLMMLSAKELVL
jgi:hypothetical protein